MASRKRRGQKLSREQLVEAALAMLADEDLAQLDRVAAPARSVWTPDQDNKPQCMAWESQADQIGFGGAAGGGKSDLALGMALEGGHERVQVFRREGTELGALIDRAAEILGTRQGLGGKPPVWRNPTRTCRIIEFCSAPNLGDEQKFQGRPKDLLVFDEATNFLESQVRFMLTWLRTTTEGVRTRLLLTFNPPVNVEGRWVLKFFAPWLDKKHPRPAKPGELRWFATIGDHEVELETGAPFKDDKGRLVQPKSRTFIPSRATDNKYLMRTGYMDQLDSLPEPLRSQMRDGDFQAGVEDDPYQVIPTAWVELAQKRWKAKDVKPSMDSIGVDVAMGGRDNTILQRRHGTWFDTPIVRTGLESRDGPTIAGWVIAAQRNQAVVHIDVFGVGAEPYAHLMQCNVQVVGVNGGEKTVETTSAGKLGFFNVRSLLWWRMREALDPNANNGIALPPDPRILADLCAPTWQPVGGKIKVEGREDIIKKIGRSPDFGTAVILAWLSTPKIDEVRGLDARTNQAMDPLTRFDRGFVDPDRDYGRGGGGPLDDPLSRV